MVRGELCVCYFSLLVITVLFLLTVVQPDLASVVRVVAGRAQSRIETHTVNISHTGTHWDTQGVCRTQCGVLTTPVTQEDQHQRTVKTRYLFYFKQKIF